MYCICGTEIDVDSRWNGLEHYTIFTYNGEVIGACTGCGESITAWLNFQSETLTYRKGSLLDEQPKSR